MMVFLFFGALLPKAGEREFQSSDRQYSLGWINSGEAFMELSAYYEYGSDAPGIVREIRH
jgi:hypothetical protein